MLKVKFAGLALEIAAFIVMAVCMVRGVAIPEIIMNLFIVGLLVCTIAGILERQSRKKK